MLATEPHPNHNNQMEASKELLAVIKYYAANDDLEGLAEDLCLVLTLDDTDATSLSDYLSDLKSTD